MRTLSLIAAARVSAVLASAALMSAALPACQEPQPERGPAAPQPPVSGERVTVTRQRAGPVPPAWVAHRAGEAERRLNSTEPGRLLWQAIEAHGGLAAWLAFGTVEFEFDYAPIDKPARRMHTVNQVDLWSAKARQREVGEGADAELGFDGERAWIRPRPEAFPSPARFWATTPYYFYGIPFVLADPGTRVESLRDADLGGERHQVVKVSYEPGTGDSPDDYYVVYIHPETHLVHAIRYIVAYPGFFPPGSHGAEKLMLYLEQREVQGLILAHRYETYAWDEDAGVRLDNVTHIFVKSPRFGESWPASIFEPPEGARTFTDIAPPRE